MKRWLAALLLSLSGCGSVMGLQECGPVPYVGVLTDSIVIHGSFGGSPHGFYQPTPLFGIILMLDVPFSLAIDTAMLPFSLVYNLVVEPKGIGGDR